MSTEKISGVILAGGQGRRMGGVDKGLQVLGGRTMIEHVIARFAPQVDEIVINANQNLERYAAFGYTVAPDVTGGFAGPLAGLQAGLKAAKHPFVVTAPCDSPFLPLDLVDRLASALGDRQLAVAKTGDQAHPVFALVRRDVLEHLSAYLSSGGRKIDAWYASLNVVEVEFDDEAEGFSNINTREELRAGENGARLDSPPRPSMTDDLKGKSSLAPFSIPLSIESVVSCMDGYDPDALRVDKACEAIRACLTPITGIEKVATRSALGRVLAEEIVPAIDVPAHDNSAMDGYALRAAELAVSGDTTLKEAGTALAGKKFQGTLGAGECVRVMTGAVMPPGADTVVIQEVVQSKDGRVVVPAGQKKGQNVRYAGEDLKTGVPVLHAGHALRPAEIGLIASLGIAEVMVKRRLRVAFFSTGDELASIGSPLGEGQVYDSNRYTLFGMLQRLGVEILDMGVVKDDPAALENALRTAATNADVIITSGGVSVGEADFIKAMMAKLGEVLFWRIAMRPGRPMAFGRIEADGQSAFLFGLPGNPVAVMVTFHQFVRDALLFLAGRTGDYSVPLLRVPCEGALRKVPGRTEYQRGVLSNVGGEWRVRLTGQQGSGVLRSMSEANCFIVLEHDRGNINAGDLVSVQLFEGLI